MPPVLVIRHDADAGPGYLGDALERAGLEMAVLDPSGTDLPVRGRWAGVVSLGGSMGAYQEEAYPWLAAEKRFMKSWLTLSSR